MSNKVEQLGTTDPVYEIQSAFDDLNEFDRVHGSTKRKIGYPRVTLYKDLLAVNGKVD